MFYIIAGTNRKNSVSGQLAKYVEKYYSKDFEVEIIDLYDVPLHELTGDHYAGEKPPAIAKVIEKIGDAEGLLMIVPEYNGSMPGALKYFMDHWTYPDTFDNQRVGFIGLGWAFAGLRPVEHLQQVFGYRNAFLYPERVFLRNIGMIFKDGVLDEKHTALIEKQSTGFIDFIKRLK